MTASGQRMHEQQTVLEFSRERGSHGGSDGGVCSEVCPADDFHKHLGAVDVFGFCNRPLTSRALAQRRRIHFSKPTTT